MKKSRTPKAVNIAWDVIVKSMRALNDEDRDIPLAQDLSHLKRMDPYQTLGVLKKQFMPN